MSIRQDVLKSLESKPLTPPKSIKKVSSYFGESTFSIPTMKKCISKKTFTAFEAWLEKGVQITLAQANEIAAAMKDWAVSRGVTYYTHWFQPMTGMTAEKHDSFITFVGPGKVIERFSGSKLIKGEPDASSFPSGGIRTTFEARGYTAWDPSSPAFIIESTLGKTLCIPTIFVSYHGYALDKKLPLLRSIEALSRSAAAFLKLFGAKGVTKVVSTCGPELEYFLIDKNFYKLRPDLVLTGRTLVGAPSPKDQQMEDQYFGSIKERVVNFMYDVGQEAYRLGIPVMTRHNEVAPHQYEFAPIFEESNLATDHNQLLMDLMKKVALRHDLVCLLHEKPFAGINGSGKHLNWSLADNKGNNLLNPGSTPQSNLQFLAILSGVLLAVSKHADLLRASVAFAGNEHRLGANEAPPAIISVFLGDQLSEILDTIEKGKTTQVSHEDIMNLGVGTLPAVNKDMTDRNRTSPFAFTGNKFEFRTVGSSQNISTPITFLNAIVADALDEVRGRIEKAAKKKDFNSAVLGVIAEIVKETRKIRFEGNNYAPEWKQEAARRGLPNEPSTAGALKALVKEENVALLKRQHVFMPEEIKARHTIWLEMYLKLLEIEARTLSEIVNSSVVPNAFDYQGLLAANLQNMVALQEKAGVSFDTEAFEDQKRHLADVTQMIYYVRKNTQTMMAFLEETRNLEEEERAQKYYSELMPMMEHIRKHSDLLEGVISDEHWDLPKYREILFVK